MKHTFSFFFLTVLSSIALAYTPQRFSKGDVERLVSSGKVRSVEGFLKALAWEGRDAFLANYVLMFHSRSLQEASFTEPRVIMFSNGDEFVITFGGSQETLEMMGFDRKERAFKFFEVDFTKPPIEAVSSDNPKKCLTCHRSDPRPNWEPYFFWPGMYGGIDDEFTSQIAYLSGKYGEDFLQHLSRSERASF